MISNEALQEFKKIWREQFGEDITDAKALEEGINLLTLFNAIYRPIKKEWADEYDLKNEQNPSLEK
ncbi:MAG: hypothetical protein PHS79_03825 [Patescibacteria group bacterium]|nr:hypothetical protein [Patescibacteria group bacterium]